MLGIPCFSVISFKSLIYLICSNGKSLGPGVSRGLTWGICKGVVISRKGGCENFPPRAGPLTGELAI